MENILEKRINLYIDFIKEGKVSPLSSYNEKIIELKEILTLLKEDKLTPEIFNTFESRDKWDISNELKNVNWYCNRCGSKHTPPKRRLFGAICCLNCDSELTRRTGGGQSDPFGWTFKFNKLKIRKMKINKIIMKKYLGN